MDPYTTPGGKKELTKQLQQETAREHHGQTPSNSDTAKLQSEVDRDIAQQPHSQPEPGFSQAAMYSQPLPSSEKPRGTPSSENAYPTSPRMDKYTQFDEAPNSIKFSPNERCKVSRDTESTPNKSSDKSEANHVEVSSSAPLDKDTERIIVRGVMESGGEKRMEAIEGKSIEISDEVAREEALRLKQRRDNVEEEFENTPHFAVVDK